jgi:hypothetical protein
MNPNEPNPGTDEPIPAQPPKPAPDAPRTGSPMDDEPEPGTDPFHEGP